MAAAIVSREETDCECESECGDNCLNRTANVQCVSLCTIGDGCTNRRFQRNEYAPCAIFQTENGDRCFKATADIPAGAFIGKYIGEIINERELARREQEYSKSGKKEFYVMFLERGFYGTWFLFIDATKQGNKFQFINHSCDLNAETENGETIFGFYSIKPIKSGEEITFNHQFKLIGCILYKKRYS